MNDGGRSLTEQMTYNGYLAPRIQVLSGTQHRRGARIVRLVASARLANPCRSTADFMVYRSLAPMPFSVFIYGGVPSRSPVVTLRDCSLADGRW